MATTSDKTYSGIGDSFEALKINTDFESIQKLLKLVVEDDTSLIGQSTKIGKIVKVQIDSSDRPIGLAVIIESSNSNNVSTLFPRTYTEMILKLEIDKVTAFSHGEAVIEATIINKVDECPSITFFATDFTANQSRYVVGAKLSMHISGLAYSIQERPRHEVEFIVKEGPLKGESMNSSKMVGFMSLDDVAVINTPFVGLKEKPYKFKYSGEKIKEFVFDMLPPFDDEGKGSWFKIPVYIPAHLLVGKDIQKKTPVDIKAQLQGYIAD